MLRVKIKPTRCRPRWVRRWRSSTGTPVVREALGQPIFERFLTAKEQEWQAFGRHISNWELSRYLEGA